MSNESEPSARELYEVICQRAGSKQDMVAEVATELDKMTQNRGELIQLAERAVSARLQAARTIAADAACGHMTDELVLKVHDLLVNEISAQANAVVALTRAIAMKKQLEAMGQAALHPFEMGAGPLGSVN